MRRSVECEVGGWSRSPRMPCSPKLGPVRHMRPAASLHLRTNITLRLTWKRIHPRHGGHIQTERSHCATATILHTTTHTTCIDSQSFTRAPNFRNQSQCASYTQLDTEFSTRTTAEKHHVDWRYWASQVVRPFTRRKSRANDAAKLQPGHSASRRSSYRKLPHYSYTVISSNICCRAA